MNTFRLLLRCAAAASIVVLATASQAQQKTAKACEAEWRANKAAIQGAGKTKKAFMVECRSGAAAAAPSTEPAQAQAPAATPPAARTAKRTRQGTATSAGEFATETQARAHCPGDNVVWGNRHSKIYHFAGSRSYGNTKAGAYMCERDSASLGFRSAKNEKRPR